MERYCDKIQKTVSKYFENFKKYEFFILSTLMSLRKDTANSVGKLEHVILQHQKVIILILQKNDMTFYISINRSERGIEKLITLIKKVI